MHLKLTIQVDRVLYSALAQPDVAAAADPLAANGGSTAAAASSGTAGTTTLHVSGKVTSENEHVKKGAFHTLDLEIGRDFTIIKGEGEWDSVARERIKEMTEPGRGADVGAIVCGEGESAQSLLPLERLLRHPTLQQYHDLTT
jgi:protein pelota